MITIIVDQLERGSPCLEQGVDDVFSEQKADCGGWSNYEPRT